MTGMLDPKDPNHTNLLIPVNGRRVERVWYPDSPLQEATRNGMIEACAMSDLECCGFVDTNEDFWFVRNIHAEPSHNFLMQTESAQNTLDEIEKVGEDVLGIFHSHPNNHPWPTTRDIVGWPDPRLLPEWRYFIVLSNDVMEWRLIP